MGPGSLPVVPRTAFSTEGRSGRPDFLLAVLVFGGLFVGGAVLSENVTGWVGVPVALIGLAQLYVAGVRRCHDLGDSGVLVRIFLVAGMLLGLPVAVLHAVGQADTIAVSMGLFFSSFAWAMAAPVLFLAIVPGDKAANRYGLSSLARYRLDVSEVDEDEPLEPVSEETATALRNLDDRELLHIAVVEPGGYARGAVEFARDEVTRRGL